VWPFSCVTISGVNRAHPYLAKGAGALTEHIDQLFKTVHSTGFNTSTQVILTDSSTHVTTLNVDHAHAANTPTYVHSDIC
jgi:hypothetical protein